MGRYEWHRQWKEGKNLNVCGARVKPPVLGHGLVNEHPKSAVGSRSLLWLWGGRGSPFPVLKDGYKSVCSVKQKQVGGGVCKKPLAAGNGLTQEIMTDNNKRQQEVGAW